MQFPTLTSPYTERPNSVADSMQWVLVALIPGMIAMFWFFRWGVLFNLLLAVATAMAAEAFVMKLRGRPVAPALRDLSALVTAVLFALAIPPILPWWLTVIGMLFAILVVKQLYGGLGYNPFNPAMAAYVLLLISWPVPMTSWPPALPINPHPLDLAQTFHLVFGGILPAGLDWDAITSATALDFVRTQLDLQHTISEIRQNPLLAGFGNRGWDVVALCYLGGGLWLLYKRVITWHIPASLLGALFLLASIAFLLDPETHPSPLFHLLSGAAMLGAFFIATDPVTACTTKRGQLFFGAGIGALIYVIRTWGGYPDAVAFSVLLMNLAAPTIDHYTQPRVFGHRSASHE
jgi:Na+-translocating ferredoxin:NAD+ oxidoreductase subunit D